MADSYAKFVNSGAGSLLASKLGLPKPEKLRRFEPGQPPVNGPIIVTGSGSLTSSIRELLEPTYTIIGTRDDGSPATDGKIAGLVIDATGFATPADSLELYETVNPVIRKLAPCARIVVIGHNPETTTTAAARVAQRGLEGFTRSLAKEMRRGATVQLVYTEPNTPLSSLESTLRFLLSGKSAYVDAQVIRLNEAPSPSVDWDKPLKGKSSVVTGAARGIRKTIAQTLARDGAHVICVDIPAAGEALAETANEVNGTSLGLDVTAPDAADTLARHVKERHQTGIDIIVHNAGITRDKTMAGMDDARWKSVMAVNITAPLTITERLLELEAINDNGRVIGVSSMAGIAGNRGQTNYAYSKAGVIGFVDSFSESAGHGITVNAVAPGFIETQMTAAIPVVTREVGRRLNSLQQGGLTIDVAETIAYFASPASEAINGNVIRVCGQSVLGA